MSQTPLNDFLATLADPATLERFREDAAGTATAAGLSMEMTRLVMDGHPGAIRIAGVQELERAGLAPLLSHKFAAAPGTSGAGAGAAGLSAGRGPWRSEEPSPD